MSDGVRVGVAPPRGMVAVKADLSVPDVARHLGGVPDPLRADIRTDRTVLWMAPDEVLIVMDHGAAAQLVTRLADALAGSHALVADMSDARCHFILTGRGWRDVLSKLTPADMHPDAFGTGHVRRTRLGQVAALIHAVDPDVVHVMAFRSVADYVSDLLTDAARPGAAVGYFEAARG